ncbi:hypothetical protein FRB99_005425 [Tulasnella sp. 403]|nr:hypothetical protein FRB99_005425 [Tulasnella sp. 403]
MNEGQESIRAAAGEGDRQGRGRNVKNAAKIVSRDQQLDEFVQNLPVMEEKDLSNRGGWDTAKMLK